MKEFAKAAVFTGVDMPFEIKEYPITPTPEGMARLELVASGICGTDIHIHRGKIPSATPAIIGHEFVGQVADISNEDTEKYSIAIGDYVIVDIACACGECPLCKENNDANCINMAVTNAGDPSVAPHFFGGYGEVNYSPVKNMIKIPKGLDPKIACAYACAGPTTIHAFSLAERAGCQLEKAKVAVVQGLGPVGTFAALYFASLGIPNVVCITAHKNEARERVAIQLGATNLLYLSEGEESVTAYIKELSGGLGADVVFEASGNPKAVPLGMEMLRNRGTYLVPGQYSNSGKIEISPQLITFNALHIIGSSQYSVCDVQAYIAFMQAHPEIHSTIGSLISCYTIEEINEAFDDIKAGKNIKTMLANCETGNIAQI